MARSAVAIRHVHFEHLGTFHPVLKSRFSEVAILDAGLDDLAALKPNEPDLLIVLGGPIGAYEDTKYAFLKDELRLLEVRLSAGRPTLGICLGAQLMARVLGSRVYPGPGQEIGWSPLTLTASGQSSPLRYLAGLSVLHWHGDTFDLPDGAALLASTPAFAHQGFSSGPNILGLQFHGEVDAREIERWLVGHACEIAAAGLDIEELRRGARENGQPLKRAGTALIDDWLSGLNL